MTSTYSGFRVTDPEYRIPHSTFHIPHSDEAGGLDVVGWFCADPCIGIFPRRLSLEEIQASLPKSAGLFLLVNPSSGQGAFYQWDGRHYMPTNGFYEAIRNDRASPVVAWKGEVQGAESWLGSLGMRNGEVGIRNARSDVVPHSEFGIPHFHALPVVRGSAVRPVIKRRSARETIMTVGSLLGIIAVLAFLVGTPQTNQGSAPIPEPTATEAHSGVNPTDQDRSLISAPEGIPTAALSPLPTQAASDMPLAQPTSAPAFPPAGMQNEPETPTGTPQSEQKPPPVDVSP